MYILSILNESERSFVYFQTGNATYIARHGWFKDVSHLRFYTEAMTLYEV